MVAIEELIPHRFPFRFVDRAVRSDENGGEFLLELEPDDGRAPDGTFAPLLLVEALAQSAAAWHGGRMASMGATEPETGMLASIDTARLMGSAHTGETVRLEVRRGHRLGAMMRFDGRASCDDRLLATARLTVVRTGPGTTNAR